MEDSGGLQKKNKKQLFVLSCWLLVKRGERRRDGVTELTVAWTEWIVEQKLCTTASLDIFRRMSLLVLVLKTSLVAR